MRCVGVIPARWAATRFEGKILAPLAGKPMIQHVWERARQCASLQDVWIACDDARIEQAAKEFGAKVMMTSPDHASGTDRIAQAVALIDVDVVVNIQGDEPLIKCGIVDQLVNVLIEDSTVPMATVVKAIISEADFQNPNVVKVVLNAQQQAMYFSRASIPYPRGGQSGAWGYKHLGLYAYRKDFLLKLTQLPPSKLEQLEKLEQLRVLEAGYAIKTVLTTEETIGVDTPEDLEKVRVLLQKDGVK